VSLFEENLQVVSWFLQQGVYVPPWPVPWPSVIYPKRTLITFRRWLFLKMSPMFMSDNWFHLDASVIRRHLSLLMSIYCVVEPIWWKTCLKEDFRQYEYMWIFTGVCNVDIKLKLINHTYRAKLITVSRI